MQIIKNKSHLITRLPVIITVILIVSLTPYFCLQHITALLFSGELNLETYYSDENIYRKIGKWSTQALVFGFLAIFVVIVDLTLYLSREKPKKDNTKNKGPFI